MVRDRPWLTSRTVPYALSPVPFTVLALPKCFLAFVEPMDGDSGSPRFSPPLLAMSCDRISQSIYGSFAKEKLNIERAIRTIASLQRETD